MDNYLFWRIHSLIHSVSVSVFCSPAVLSSISCISMGVNISQPQNSCKQSPRHWRVGHACSQRWRWNFIVTQTWVINVYGYEQWSEKEFFLLLFGTRPKSELTWRGAVTCRRFKRKTRLFVSSLFTNGLFFDKLIFPSSQIIRWTKSLRHESQRD